MVKLNGNDLTSQIDLANFQVQQIIGRTRNTASFVYKKYGARSYVPAVFDTVQISDTDGDILTGRILSIQEDVITASDGIIYSIQAVDYSVDMDNILISKTYSNQNCLQIIQDMVGTAAPSFTTNNVAIGPTIVKIVFNLVPMSECLKRLADMIKFDWYVDTNKDIHFFSKYTNTAPYNLTDTSGNYVNQTLSRLIDGSQLSNQVKVRGGQYAAATFTDARTIKGNVTYSITLPYQFVNLTAKVNGVSKTVGTDGKDNFTSYDLLYNYTNYSLRGPAYFNDGDVIEFSGNPMINVLAVASDAPSIAQYGVREKLIEDNTIVDIDTARKRAIAELGAYKDPQNEITFDTYTAGLRRGMVINLNSTRRNANVDFLIKSVTFQPRTATTFVYTIQAVTIKSYTLTDILQSLLQPASFSTSDSEVTDIIKTDLATITIAESITRKSADHTDNVAITISESINKDPLGAGVSPTWVLGPYFPSSPSDTKRIGLLDNSMQVY